MLPRPGLAGPRQCYNCGRAGHDARDCQAPRQGGPPQQQRRPQQQGGNNGGVVNVIQYSRQEYQHEYDELEPTSYDDDYGQAYAKRNAPSITIDRSRAPVLKKRVPYPMPTPGRQDVRAENPSRAQPPNPPDQRRAQGPGPRRPNEDEEMMDAEQRAPRPLPRRYATAPQPRGGAYDIIGQLSSTSAKMTMEQAIKECPRVRDSLKGYIRSVEDNRSNNNMAREATDFNKARLGLATGHEGVICQAEILIEGNLVTDAIIDTGASHTSMSHVLVRKLGLYKYVQKSDMIFSTAAGTTEKSSGVLKDLRITIGDLTLTIDVQVTQADCYSILVGYDYLYSAGANIELEKNRLSYRRDQDTRGSIPLRTVPSSSSRPGVNALLQEHDSAQMYTLNDNPTEERDTMPLKWNTPQGDVHTELDIESIYGDSIPDEEETPGLLGLDYSSGEEEPPPLLVFDYSSDEECPYGLVEESDEEELLYHYDSEEDMSQSDEDDYQPTIPDDAPEVSLKSAGRHTELPLYFNHQGVAVEIFDPEASEEESALRRYNPDGTLARAIVSAGEWRRIADVPMPPEGEADAYQDTQFWVQHPWMALPPGVTPTVGQEYFSAEELNLQYQDFKYMTGNPSGPRQLGYQRPPQHRWCIGDNEFRIIQDTYGEFELDAFPHNIEDRLSRHAANNLGMDWAGCTVWGLPPFDLVGDTLEHFLECHSRRHEYPGDTLGVFLVPDLPNAPWYPLIEKHFNVANAYDHMAPILKGAPGTEYEHWTGAAGWINMLLIESKDPMTVYSYPPDISENGDAQPPAAPQQEGATGGPAEQGNGAAPLQAQNNGNDISGDFTDLLKTGEKLTKDQERRFKAMLRRHRNAFAMDRSELGLTHLGEHTIDTGDARPIALRPYRLSKYEEEAANVEIAKLVAEGVLEESRSPWQAPIVLVEKKDGGKRLTIDFRRLNAITVKDVYPMPREPWDKLSGSKYFSALDMLSGFFQMGIAPKDAAKTAFASPSAKWQFKRMPQGLCNSPASFQRMVDHLITGDMRNFCCPYLDDLLVHSASFEEHLQHVEAVLIALENANLRAHAKKCEFGLDEVKYLGHKVSAAGIAPDPSKIEAIQKMLPPQSVTDIRSFLGITGYYRRFVKDFAAIARPLHELTKLGVEFNWSESCQTAWEELKERLITAPILQHPDFNEPFILQTDWQPSGIGAVLAQIRNNREHVIAYGSRALRGAEVNYAPTEGECAAVVHFVKHFRHYLHGRRFKIQTDHLALKWLMTTSDVTGQLARWALKLQGYDFEILYRPGKQNANADALSRLKRIEDNKATEQSNGMLYMKRGWQQESSSGEQGVSSRGRKIFSTKGRTLPGEEQEETEESSPEERITYNEDLPSRQEAPIGPPHSAEAIAASRARLLQQVARKPLGETSAAATLEVSPTRHSTFAPATRPIGRSKAATGLRRTVNPESEIQPAEEDEEEEEEEGEEEADAPLEDEDDTRCEVCNLPHREESMLLCDNCDRGFHIDCLDPPLQKIPSGIYWCEECKTSSLADMAKRQEVDITEDQAVIDFLTSGDLPEDTAERKRVKSRAKQYAVRDGLLYKQKNEEWRQVPLVEEREELIRRRHDFLGHMGINSTADVLSKEFWWWGLTQDVRHFVSNCPACKMQRTRFDIEPEMRPIDMEPVPFRQVGIDLQGPYQRSTSGNNTIMVVMDYFTKFMEAIALPDKSSATVANAFTREIICRYGCPTIVISDNGTEFAGEFAELMKDCGIEHRHSSPGHPQTNGLTERMNRTISTALSREVAVNGEDWDTFLPRVLLGLRSAMQASTRYSPYYLLFGRAPSLPGAAHSYIENLAKVPETEEDMEAMADILIKMGKDREYGVHSRAMANIQAAQARQKKGYDARHIKEGKQRKAEASAFGQAHHKFKPGDFVWMKPIGRAKAKLKSDKEGPFKVIKINDKDGTSIKIGGSDGTTWSRHVRDLAPFDESRGS